MRNLRSYARKLTPKYPRVLVLSFIFSICFSVMLYYVGLNQKPLEVCPYETGTIMDLFNAKYWLWHLGIFD